MTTGTVVGGRWHGDDMPTTPARRRRRGIVATIWAGIIACIIGSCGTAAADPGPTPAPPGPGGFGSGWAQCGGQLVPADPRVDMQNPLGGLIYREMLRHMCSNPPQGGVL